jgi:hypothetical protein
MQGMPPAAGQVRFRLTTGDNPDSFMAGSDFHLENGLLWNIPLLAMVQPVCFEPLLELLLADGLVTRALVEKCNKMMQENYCTVNCRSSVIHSLGQPFPFNFAAVAMSFAALSSKELCRTVLTGCFNPSRDVRLVAPYSGEYMHLNLPELSLMGLGIQVPLSAALSALHYRSTEVLA